MIPNSLAIFTIAVFAPTIALACPKAQPDQLVPDHLYSALRNADNEMQGRAINNQIWEIWIKAPDEQSQKLMDLGRERIRVADYERAGEVFGELIEYCPHYAEGWNQRAFVWYLRQDYERALEDLATTIELEPRHFGALAGRATTLISMGRVDVGHAALREALKVNPWLSERHMLPAGSDI